MVNAIMNLVGVGIYKSSQVTSLHTGLEAYSCHFRRGAFWKHFYSNNLAIDADTVDICILKLQIWKMDGMDNKGMQDQHEKDLKFSLLASV